MVEQIPFEYQLASCKEPVKLVVVGNCHKGYVLCAWADNLKFPCRIPYAAIPEHNRQFIDESVTT